MTTRDEYAEAAELLEDEARYQIHKGIGARYELAARVLRQLAEGAVLCEKTKPGPMDDVDAIYTPIEEPTC
jgi:hypothetical protein